MKITWHRFPADRTFVEKLLRKFTFPNYDHIALTSVAWRKRDAKLRSRFPIRWFFNETCIDFWNYEVKARYNTVRNWLRYRTTARYHVVKLQTEPGYMDPDTRLMMTNFQILKDYVEIELAAMNEATNNCEGDEPLHKAMGRFRKKYRRGHRYPDKGLQYLDWEIKECAGNVQGTTAAEKKELYLWWTQYRPARLEVYSDPLIWGKDERSGEDLFNGSNAWEYHLCHELENMYHREDEEMLIRLMKIRTSLWT
jgi:hypothetical protein